MTLLPNLLLALRPLDVAITVRQQDRDRANVVWETPEGASS